MCSAFPAPAVLLHFGVARLRLREATENLAFDALMAPMNRLFTPLIGPEVDTLIEVQDKQQDSLSFSEQKWL